MPTKPRNTQFDIVTGGWSAWLINGVEASQYMQDVLNDQLSDDSPPSHCRYCRCEFSIVQFEDQGKADDTYYLHRRYSLGFCGRCYHWEFQGYEGSNQCMDEPDIVVAASVAAKFETLVPNGCSHELAQHLRRQPLLWHELAPKQMERLVVDIFRANHRHCEVLHVGGPGDRGVDVLFIDDGGRRWLVQVKRRAKPKKAEGFATLQSVLGTLALTGERYGMIATTADHFSAQARQESRRARDQGFYVELLDKGMLDRMIGPLIPRNPWAGLLDHPSLHYVADDVRMKLFSMVDSDQLDFFPS